MKKCNIESLYEKCSDYVGLYDNIEHLHFSLPFISRCSNVPLYFIQKHRESIDWNSVIRWNKNITEDFIESNIAYIKNIECNNCSMSIVWSDNFICNNYKKINFDTLWMFPRSELLINYCRNYLRKQDWDNICLFSVLSEKFIIKNDKYLNWDNIALKHNFSENFINKYSEKLNWYNISIQADITEKMMYNYWDKINFNGLLFNKNIAKWLSLKNVNDFRHKLDKIFINDNKFLICKEFLKFFPANLMEC